MRVRFVDLDSRNVFFDLPGVPGVGDEVEFGVGSVSVRIDHRVWMLHPDGTSEVVLMVTGIPPSWPTDPSAPAQSDAPAMLPEPEPEGPPKIYEVWGVDGQGPLALGRVLSTSFRAACRALAEQKTSFVNGYSDADLTWNNQPLYRSEKEALRG